ncbi:cysteine proteinase 5 precursor [Dictyostelium discoideum AX4]|uniref:Cysteine proteinase 5 n=1 Tax=Dictyostelium discoideum TaxID=44689 RepID=CYSP5_DICDI|nr:cysteine proteinase 5 precursor [Dictyostelium discoideum AX4]P54640.2 RecName: Full=Cysteine proteinase 5; Flags: Precursor [Dictyostelium discoideum]EAL71045.1 cysteine proteinase 5 precursor [Dictyostelium discoideum AX4]|eukprot:XP_644977.1 cysteine proteinase 5 precursor [Dictyostelium discoideum AX4]
MKVLSFLCVLLVSVATAKQQFSELQYRNAFTDWMITHQKSYTSEEFGARYNIFKANMDYVQQWNSKGSETVLGLNNFADITNEEYRNTYLGTKFDASSLIGTQEEKVFTTSSAASKDWRSEGAVTPVKNQGQCGGCWSFSTTGSTEGAHFQSKGELVSLSEQNLIDCSTENSGCDGGLMTYAFEYIINNNGIDTESSYPYKAENGKCEYKSENSGATLSSYKTVTAGSESSLESAVNVNPVSVAIDASHQSFQLYTSGIYYEPECSSENLDHGVLAVGYGSGSGSSSGQSSGQSSGNLSASSSNEYWIVKNSWGTSWGIEGYILMSRNRDNNCGIASSASFPVV